MLEGVARGVVRGHVLQTLLALYNRQVCHPSSLPPTCLVPELCLICLFEMEDLTHSVVSPLPSPSALIVINHTQPAMGPSLPTHPRYPVIVPAPMPRPIPRPFASNFSIPRNITTHGKRKRSSTNADTDPEDLDAPPSHPWENPNAALNAFPKVRISRIKAQPPRRRLRRNDGSAGEPAAKVPQVVWNVTRRAIGEEAIPGAGIFPGPPPVFEDPESIGRCDTPNAICCRCLTPVYLDEEEGQTGTPNASHGGISAPQPAPWMPYSQGGFTAGAQTPFRDAQPMVSAPAWGGCEAPQFQGPASSFPWGRNQMDDTALWNVNTGASVGVEKPYMRGGDLYTPNALGIFENNVPLQSTFPTLNSSIGQGYSFPAFGQEPFFGGPAQSFDGGLDGGFDGGFLGLQGGLQGGRMGGLQGCSGYNQMGGYC